MSSGHKAAETQPSSAITLGSGGLGTELGAGRIGSQGFWRAEGGRGTPNDPFWKEGAPPRLPHHPLGQAGPASPQSGLLFLCARTVTFPASPSPRWGSLWPGLVPPPLDPPPSPHSSHWLQGVSRLPHPHGPVGLPTGACCGPVGRPWWAGTPRRAWGRLTSSQLLHGLSLANVP